MKKVICLVFVFIVMLLSACSPSSPNNQTTAYSFNRSGISEIKGTSQMSEEVQQITIRSDKQTELLDKLEALNLQKTGGKNEEKGYLYLFSISYDNGQTIQISLQKDRAIIDNYIFDLSAYNPDEFAVFFNK